MLMVYWISFIQLHKIRYIEQTKKLTSKINLLYIFNSLDLCLFTLGKIYYYIIHLQSVLWGERVTCIINFSHCDSKSDTDIIHGV